MNSFTEHSNALIIRPVPLLAVSWVFLMSNIFSQLGNSMYTIASSCSGHLIFLSLHNSYIFFKAQFKNNFIYVTSYAHFFRAQNIMTAHSKCIMILKRIIFIPVSICKPAPGASCVFMKSFSNDRTAFTYFQKKRNKLV